VSLTLSVLTTGILDSLGKKVLAINDLYVGTTTRVFSFQCSLMEKTCSVKFYDVEVLEEHLL